MTDKFLSIAKVSTTVFGGNEAALFERNMSPFSWTVLNNL